MKWYYILIVIIVGGVAWLLPNFSAFGGSIEQVLTIIGVIAGITGFFLIFKLWTMCDDIAEIKKILKSTKSDISSTNQQEE